MLRINGLVLKREGNIKATDGHKSVIQWVEKSSRARTYYYLVILKGEKYTKPYRLKPYEIDYWIDTIERMNVWKK